MKTKSLLTASGTQDIWLHIGSACWSGTQFVATTFNRCSSDILTSPDGISWERKDKTHEGPLNFVTWTGEQFIAVGDHGAILTSLDAISWVIRESGTTQNLHSVVWTGRQLVAVGSGFTILTSPDGLIWTAQKAYWKPRAEGLLSITWTGNLLVAVGQRGRILTSSDGLYWRERYGVSSLGEITKALVVVIWTGCQLVAAANDGYVLSSANGEDWVSTGSLYGISSMVWAGNQLVAVGKSNDGYCSGMIATSQDGKVWTKQQSGAKHKLDVVVWTGSKLIGFAPNSTILTSTDAVKWS